MKILEEGSVTSPRGFRAGAVYAGLKTPGPGKLDLALLVSDVPGRAAGVFTQSRAAAAPVLLDRERLRAGVAQAVIVNAGNANASTGAQGRRDAAEMARLAAQRLGLDPSLVLVASTGVIGVPLPRELVRAGVARIEPTRDGGHAAARAIMTTDTRPKEIALEFELSGATVRIGGMAKGAGMIHPNLATMLAFITTDAAVDASFLQAALRAAAERSFNQVTVDGDTSTNDSVIVLANGLAGHPLVVSGSAAAATFQEALEAVCVHLAKEIARDGEGATRLIEVTVRGAVSDAEARLAARTVAGSQLFKAAVYGGDPNWGRIIAALGRSGAELDQDRVDAYLGDVPVARAGQPLDFDRPAASAALKEPVVRVLVDLHLGPGVGTAWGCDLTEEYVRINSEYTT